MNDGIEVNENIEMIPISKIHPPKFDIRRWRKEYEACEDMKEYKEHFGKLAKRIGIQLDKIEDSLKDEGFQGVLLVRPRDDEKYEVIDGYTRFSILKENGVDKVPCIIQEVSDMEAIRLNYRVNKEDIDVRWWTTLHMLQHVKKEYGLSQNETCKKLGVDKGYGSKLFKISSNCKDYEIDEYMDKGLGYRKVLDEIEGNNDDDPYTCFFNPVKEIPKEEGKFIFMDKENYRALKNARDEISKLSNDISPKEIFPATVVKLAEKNGEHIGSAIGIKQDIQEIRVTYKEDMDKIRRFLDDKDIKEKAVNQGLHYFYKHLLTIIEKITGEKFLTEVKQDLQDIEIENAKIK